MLELCMLGTGGALPLPDRGLTACYLRVRGRGLLIDCGEGTQTAIRRLGWGFRCIDGMLITHYHGDHCGGLPGFLLSLGKAERREPFHIWGYTGLKAIVEGLRVVAPVLPFPVVLHEFSGERVELSMIGLEITGFRLDHGVPCYGWRLELPRQGAFQPQRAKALGVPVRDWKRLQAGETVNGVTPEQVMGPPRQGIRLLYATDTRPHPGYHPLWARGGSDDPGRHVRGRDKAGPGRKKPPYALCGGGNPGPGGRGQAPAAHPLQQLH